MSIYDDKPWQRFYDPNVTAEISIPDSTYLNYVEKGLKYNPQQVAFYYLGTSCTYAQLDSFSARFAAFLVEKGCKKGDVVGINLPNIPQYLIAIVGAIRAGCIVSGVSPLLTAREMVHQVVNSEAKVLLTLDVLFEQLVKGIAGEMPELKQIVATGVADFLPMPKRILGKLLKKIPSGNIVPLPGKEVSGFRDIMQRYPAVAPQTELTPDDTCLLQYTGGTTGPSKGTVLTHRNFMSNIVQILQWTSQTANPQGNLLDEGRGQEVCCSGFPLFHQAGLALGMMHIGHSNTQILVPDPRNTDRICKDIRMYRPTMLINVPTLYQLLMENPLFKTIDFSGCKYCLSGAAPLDDDSLRALENIVGEGKVVEVYGMTETSPIITMNPVFGRKKIGSVGIPVQSTHVKLVDLEEGTEEVPLGEPGELIVKGPQVMKEYHRNPDATAGTIREFAGENWLYTGDVAKMDQDGYFYIVDRAKDMLLVGGYNVYSKEVEECIYEIPEVEICAVVGKPNPERPGSEIVRLVVQLKDNVAENDRKSIEAKIISHCKINMAPYKVPKIIEFMEAIPLTAIGKIDKKLLR